MSKVELTIVAITSSDTKENGFVVILKEKGGERHLPILVGSFEARAIAMEIERIFTPRPMSHDLMKQIIIEMNGDLFEVQITSLTDDVYYAALIIKMDDGTMKKIDARSSDAIALAVRFGCGIYVSPEVLTKAGVEWEGFGQLGEQEDRPMRSMDNDLAAMNKNELLVSLEKALIEEDYEKAAIIRDELEKR